MARKLYRYQEYFGRSGHLEGLFVAESDDVAKVMGRRVCFGEVLGKHSEVNGTISDKTLTVAVDDAAFVEQFSALLPDGVGINPIDQAMEELLDEEDDALNPDDEEDEAV